MDPNNQQFSGVTGVPQTPGVMPQASPQMAYPNQAMAGQTQPGQPAAASQTNPNSTQNTLQIAEIRDGIVIMNDGSLRSVVMLRSINFDLMSPE